MAAATALLNLKKDFPLLVNEPTLVYLDSASTALKPRAVIEAVEEYYTNYSANVHRGLYDLSERATAAYEGAREKVRTFIHAGSSREIIFTSGTTASINLVALSWGRSMLKRDDEIILSILDHHSNIVPWQLLAKDIGCKLKFIDCDSKGRLKLDQLSKLLSRRTKLIALSHVSNALGTINQLTTLTQKAHAIGAKVLIDAAQSVPHMPLNVEHLNCDFLAFSGHKLGGPTGIGVLYAKEELLKQMPPVFGGGDMIREVHTDHSSWNDLPWKFEAGTPPIAQAIGLGAAIDYYAKIGMSKVRAHEHALTEYALQKCAELPGLTIYGPADAAEQSGVISFTLEGVHPHDISSLLNEEKIAIRAGHHCCMPLMDRLKIPATARVSFGVYNSTEDIDRLIEGLKKVQKIFKV